MMWILSGLGWLLVLSSMGLEIAAANSMGVYRDLLVRNRALENIIFAPGMRYLFMGLLFLGLGQILWRVIDLERKDDFKKEKNQWKKRFFLGQALIVNLVTLVLIILKPQVELLAYPWMLLNMLFFNLMLGLGLIFFKFGNGA